MNTLYVQIVPRKKREGYSTTYDVCAAGHDSVYNFPTRAKAVKFCNECGFEVISGKAKVDNKCECIIYNPHYTSSRIRKEFGERTFSYRKCKTI